MWKAILVLFLMSETSPPSMMLGEFPEVFLTEADCKKFVAGKRGELRKEFSIVNMDEDQVFTVVGHRASCVLDGSGEPT